MSRSKQGVRVTIYMDINFQYSNGVLARIMSHFSVVHLSPGILNN